jgi:hypothetical protein
MLSFSRERVSPFAGFVINKNGICLKFNSRTRQEHKIYERKNEASNSALVYINPIFTLADTGELNKNGNSLYLANLSYQQ